MLIPGERQRMRRKSGRLSNATAYLLLSLLVLNLGCRGSSVPKVVAIEPKDSASKSAEPVENPQVLCGRVSEIKTLPFYDEEVDDPAYNALIKSGERVIPCLIASVNDTNPMPDPRQAPKVDTVVGDIAFFVLINITKVDLMKLLPPDVQKKFDDQGIYAYFRYTEKKRNRKTLQDKLYEWYRQKYGKDAHALTMTTSKTLATTRRI